MPKSFVFRIRCTRLVKATFRCLVLNLNLRPQDGLAHLYVPSSAPGKSELAPHPGHVTGLLLDITLTRMLLHP